MLWELLDVLFRQFLSRYADSAHFRRICPDSKNRATMKAYGTAYLKSTLHALIVSTRGWRHLYVLRLAPAVAKLQLLRNADDPIYLAQPTLLPESVGALRTNIVLAAYLLSDLIHVLAEYPHLGEFDTIAHHVAFFACALVAGGNRMVPFMFGWLIIGECSTPVLNMRWFFIKTGNGAHRAFKYIEIAFVCLFVLARVFVYGAGLAYQMYLLRIGTPVLVPMWAMTTVMALVVIGFLLNMVWLVKIAGVLRRSRARAKARKDAEVERVQVGAAWNGVPEENKAN